MASVGVVLDALKAIGEETRLRIVALLGHAELTVTDLTEILGQSQPRVSRHLKLLVDAGVVDKHREGTWVFFRLVDGGADGCRLLAGALAPFDDTDPVLAADRSRLASVQERRATQRPRVLRADRADLGRGAIAARRGGRRRGGDRRSDRRR